MKKLGALLLATLCVTACGGNSIWNGVECVCVSGFQYYYGDCILVDVNDINIYDK